MADETTAEDEVDHFALNLRSVMQTREGRAFVWQLLIRCGVFSISFTGNSQTFYKEGMRNVGLMVMGNIMGIDPQLYALMQQENAIAEDYEFTKP